MIVIRHNARAPITRSALGTVAIATNGVGGIDGKPAYVFSAGSINFCFSKREALRIVEEWDLTNPHELMALELRRALGLLSDCDNGAARFKEAINIINTQMRKLCE